jgi:hypothetical protein
VGSIPACIRASTEISTGSATDLCEAENERDHLLPVCRKHAHDASGMFGRSTSVGVGTDYVITRFNVR